MNLNRQKEQLKKDILKKRIVLEKEIQIEIQQELVDELADEKKRALDEQNQTEMSKNGIDILTKKR